LFLAEQPLGLLPQVQHRWIIWWLRVVVAVAQEQIWLVVLVVGVPEGLELGQG
jgi:hypothetical protein